jgi:hypothetical protein
VHVDSRRHDIDGAILSARRAANGEAQKIEGRGQEDRKEDKAPAEEPEVNFSLRSRHTPAKPIGAQRPASPANVTTEGVGGTILVSPTPSCFEKTIAFARALR